MRQPLVLLPCHRLRHPVEERRQCPRRLQLHPGAADAPAGLTPVLSDRLFGGVSLLGKF